MRNGTDASLYVGYAFSDAVATLSGAATVSAVTYNATHKPLNTENKSVQTVKIEVLTGLPFRR